MSYAFLTPARETLEQAALWWTVDEKKEFARDAKWTRDQHWNGLGPYRKHLSPSEAAYASATRDTMEEMQLINATWRTEALMAVLWSLEKIDEIPPYDMQTHPDLFGNFPKVDADEFVRDARLRPVEEINKARDIAESWHWRSRTRTLIEEGRPFPTDPKLAASGFHSFDDIVRAAAKTHASDGTFGEMIDEDYPAFGKAYRALSDEEWSSVRSITMERHYALN